MGTYGRPYYYTGSVLPIEWTLQHGCGEGNNANCAVIIQYYCDNNKTRDGLSTQTIPAPLTPEEAAEQCINGDCDNDWRFGRHESFDSYKSCRYRQRNGGLWTSAQNLRGNNRLGAIFTRQNNNGNRRGYECPEERDYYPYWHPTEWRDIAILTTDLAKCDAYKAESQNVKSRFYCKVEESWIQQQLASNPRLVGFIPIEKTPCETTGGVWTEVPSFGIPKPECFPAPWSRDNHLGNVADWHPTVTLNDGTNITLNYWGGHTAQINWTIPEHTMGASCVLRIRYNMTSSETHDFGEFRDARSVTAGALNKTLNFQYPKDGYPQGLNRDQNDPYAFRDASVVPIWTKYRLSYNDVRASFDPEMFNSGILPTRGYVLSDNPLIDMFGGLITTGHKLKLRLAINTNQFSRTFQDRTHVFTIKPRPAAYGSIPIHNLGVRGKRGNIVQVYPSIEYDFAPQTLTIRKGEFIHFQWTGSNTNPGNNAGQGTQGTDRSNLILLRHTGRYFPSSSLSALSGVAPAGHTGSWKMSYPSRIDDTAPEADLMGLSLEEKRNLARAGIHTPLVDIGPLQIRKEGTFNYISTRNHAFTNRDQKGRIVVLPPLSPESYTEVDYAAAQQQQLVTRSGEAWLRFAPDPIGFTSGSRITVEQISESKVLVSPPLFDVVPGQNVILEMKYNYDASRIHTIHIMQDDGNGIEYEMSTSYDGGVAQTTITRGGYYRIEKKVHTGTAVGIALGVFALVGGVGFVYYKLRKGITVGGKKKHLTTTGV